jgi:hypothetical protein
MKIDNFLILALATWRIVSLLYIEDGPYLILARFRTYIGIYYDEHTQRQADNELGKAVNCPACLSVWIGGAVALGYWILPAVMPWLCLPLALSTAAIMIEWMVPNGKS